MKILHVITGLNVGGAERALHTLLCGGLAAHCENQVISLSDVGFYGSKLEMLGVPVTCLNMRAGRPSLAAIRVFRKKLREFAPDIIQGWMYHGNFMASLGAVLAPGKPVVVWNIRQSLYDLAAEKPGTQWVIRANKWFSGQPQHILYNSHVSRKQHEAFGFKPKQGRVIPNGFDTQMWKPDAAAARDTRQMLGVTNDTKLIGYVARYHPMKGIPVFLQALAPVLVENSKVHCVMVGRNLGPKNNALAPYFAKLPMNRIHILGQRDDVAHLMPAFDVFCLSSIRGEAFPNVLGEAMACGVPCVSTDVGDARLIAGETGCVVPRSDPQEFTKALQITLSKSEEEHRVLREGARRRIKENFSLPTIISHYIELYRSLIRGENQCAE